MRILITNDDGFLSKGLRLLIEAVRELDNVSIDVVVPEKPQSAGGLSVTLHKPLRVRKISLEDGLEMFVISGKPCDAVIYALHELGDYDLVLSGVNMGENTSIQAALASGTIAACLYASLIGNVRSIAFSADVDFNNVSQSWISTSKYIIRECVKYVAMTEFPEAIDVISVNIPKRIDRYADVKVCKMSRRKFIHRIVRRVDPRGAEYVWIHGDTVVRLSEDEDTPNVLILNNITISAICARQLDLMYETAREKIESAREYLHSLAEYLRKALRGLYEGQLRESPY